MSWRKFWHYFINDVKENYYLFVGGGLGSFFIGIQLIHNVVLLSAMK